MNISTRDRAHKICLLVWRNRGAAGWLEKQHLDHPAGEVEVGAGRVVNLDKLARLRRCNSSPATSITHGTGGLQNQLQHWAL